MILDDLLEFVMGAPRVSDLRLPAEVLDAPMIGSAANAVDMLADNNVGGLAARMATTPFESRSLC